METSDNKLLYEGNSLDTFLRLKYQLESNGIKYTASQKNHDGWGRFFTQLFLFKTSRGMNDERMIHYTIYVNAGDYDRAIILLPLS